MKIETKSDQSKSFKSLAREWDEYLDEYFNDFGREVTRSVADPKSDNPARSKTYRTYDGITVEIEGSPTEIDDIEAMFEGHKQFPSRARLEGEDLPVASFLRRAK